MSGAEIIERKAGAKIPQPLEDLSRLLGIFHDGGFRELELERAARQAHSREHRAEIVDDVVLEKLPRRYIDAREQRHAAAHSALPDSELARGSFDREQAEIRDE